jgi:exonuclease SbcC
MRILRIDLKNLNSLRGEHTVDLTKEPLASAGLFAITGETGAGKSTLLDAVTLALYGRAARYGKEPNPGDMMSRHTAECRAEVVFEVPKGVFRARWELRRANNDPNGNMQQPKRHVYDDGNTPLAAQVKEADKVIENLIGLDYDRFLRSALLAQGEFSKFLKSNAAERAELLEKLTGTDQYTRLSISAFGEAKKRESDLAEKERIINELEILDDDKLAKLKQQQKAGGKRQTELKKKLDEGTGMVEKINRLKTHREKEQTPPSDPAVHRPARQA